MDIFKAIYDTGESLRGLGVNVQDCDIVVYNTDKSTSSYKTSAHSSVLINVKPISSLIFSCVYEIFFRFVLR